MNDKFSIITNRRLIFGSGEIKNLHFLLESYGNNTLLITSRSLPENPAWQPAKKALVSEGKKLHTITVYGEPTPEVIDDIVSDFRKKSIDVVIAVGGGSVIDCGKAVSAMLPIEGSVRDYLEDIGTKKPTGEKIPFVAIPTTAGTGSEVTKNAVICEKGTFGFKKSLRHDNYVPDMALVDPDLAITCPPEITTSCSMDALCQLIEAWLSKSASAYTDALVWEGLIRVCRSIGPLCIEKKNAMNLREDMALGAYMSGIGLANAGLGTVHGIAGPLGAHFEIPHGAACGTLLAETMKYSVLQLREFDKYNHALYKMSRIGILMAGNQSLSEDEAIDYFVKTLEEWTEAMNIPKLSTFMITEEPLLKIIPECSNKQNPAVLTQEIIREILLKRL